MTSSPDRFSETPHPIEPSSDLVSTNSPILLPYYGRGRRGHRGAEYGDGNRGHRSIILVNFINVIFPSGQGQKVEHEAPKPPPATPKQPPHNIPWPQTLITLSSKLHLTSLLILKNNLPKIHVKQQLW